MTYKEYKDTEEQNKERYAALNNPPMERCRVEGCPFATSPLSEYGCDYICTTGRMRGCEAEECDISFRKKEFAAITKTPLRGRMAFMFN